MVKWFNSSDELVDPLMSLGARAPSFHCCRLSPRRRYRSRPWIRDRGAGVNGLDGLILG